MSFPQNRQFAPIRSHEPAAPIWQAEAVRAGPYIFTSARMATDWKTGIPAEASTNEHFPYFESAAELQTDYILRSLSRTLESAGSGLELVFKAHVFLLDGADFLGFDRVWNRYFTSPPTRTTVGAAGLLVPGARLEIAFIALAADSGLRIEPAVSDAPRPLTKKIEAVRAGDFVFTSGQLAHNAVAGVPPQAQGPQGQSDMGRQTAYTIGNMTRSLAAAGATRADVVKGQALLLDTRQEAEFLPAWHEAFESSTHLPALGVPGISSLLVTGTLIEIDLTAYTGGQVRLPPQSGPRGPEAIGCGDLVFSAGICAGFDTGALPLECEVHTAYPHYSSAIKLQTEWVLARLDAALREVGSDLRHVAKAQVFLTDLSDFAMFDEVWRVHFPTPPARSVVLASGFSVSGARVAIEVIALSA
ncbi:RidA family protein [Variovorax sp. LT1R16]|uniref:RidA family protein n=1 Tax=Variovorax sp. LT1R16 TaxID=3443728 RepID=UPI003F44FE5E